MRKALSICLFAVCASPVGAAQTAHCDATPFTLGKPVTAVAKLANAQPKPNPASAQPAAKKPQAKADAKQRLLASCKGSKRKKSG